MTVSISALSDGVVCIQRLAAEHESLVAVAKMISELGSLEVYVAELTKKRDALMSDIEQLENNRHSWEVTSEQLLAEHEAKVVAIQEQALRLEKASEERAKAIIADGEAQAQVAGQARFDEKMALVHELNAHVESAQARLRTLAEETAGAEAVRDAVTTEKDQATSALAEIMRTIEQLSKFGSSEKKGDDHDGTK